MPSHPAVVLLSQRPGNNPGAHWVHFRLACGCELERELPATRLCQTVDGALRVVGKYPCPADHPVRRPASPQERT